MRLSVATFLTLAAAPLAAKEPLLNLPMDCTLGQTCYINDYFDRDAGEGARDYACGEVTRDNHTGVDFAVNTLQAMRDGVDVLSAAPGTVRGIRDGMEDFIKTAPGTPEGPGLDCGNNVILDHGGGWITRYCHLKNGSIPVRTGDRVAMGATLGQVGLSGATNYPHMHFSTYKDRKRVDPFNPDPADTCGIEPGEGLWQTDLPYQPGGLVRIGLAGTPPELSRVRDDLNATPDIPADAPAMVVWAHGYTVRTGDIIRAEITGPDGPFWSGDVTLNRDRKLASLNYMGRKRRADPWPQGTYFATVQLIRDDQIIAEKTVQTNVVAPTSQ